MKYNAVFISDVHIGLSDSKVEELLKFLKTVETPVIYLVGDIIDGWKLKQKFNWGTAANTFIQKIFKQARHGVKIYYVVGNHDEFMLQFVGHEFGNISVVETVEHWTVKGEKILVLHGQQFDGIIACAKWLQKLGSDAYDFLLRLNTIVNKIRIKFGLKYWSLSKYLKKKTKRAIQYVDNFENLVASYAKKHNVESILCGHIHEPIIRKIGNINYYNTGDWVENCTAIVETEQGYLQIVHIN